MWGLLANIAAKGYGLWQQKEAMEDKVEAYDRQIRVNKTLAAEQLAITYNSIQTASLMAGAAARRKEFQIRQAQRAAGGQLNVEAAQAGVAGKRAELARRMAVDGGAERMMTNLELDTQNEINQLIARADMEERATVNRLISSMPDVPDTAMSGNILDFVGGALKDYGTYKDQQTEIDDAIVLGGDTSGSAFWD